ncbi:hypothetical protein ABDK00_012370 [Niabella insulamsoli]|uniref:hypothetical protein n=1 Tax=Niabella insulamsoli TaxID=3144874 RepID=UPI0031FC06FC
MQKRLFFFILVVMLLTACTQKWVETVGDPGHYSREYEPIFTFATAKKKEMRLAASYPPSGLIDGLKSYRIRYNAWPHDLNDVFRISLDARKDVAHMLETRFSDLKIRKATQDTLIITYKYHKMPKREEANSSQIILNRSKVSRQYVFAYNAKDSSLFIENMNIK